jgi:hypothetical protein
MPISPAIFSGELNAGGTAPVISRTFVVRCATAVRKISGLGLYPPYGLKVVLNLADVGIAEFISQAREINRLAEILLGGLLRRIDAGEEVEAELHSSILNQPAPTGTTPDEASARISRSNRDSARRASYRFAGARSLETTRQGTSTILPRVWRRARS